VSVLGCSAAARHKILTVLFDGTDTPAPPTRRIRQDLLQEVDALKRQVEENRAELERLRQPAADAQETPASSALPVEQVATWDEAAALLPKNASGAVDWDAALASGAIAPRTALSPQQSAPAVFDLDVDVETSGSRTFRSAFSHAGHTRWNVCQSCHPALYPLRARTTPPAMTMVKIAQRQSCGACHGTVAFGTANACSRCHTAVPSRTAWQPSESPRALLETLHRWEEALLMLPSSASDGAPEWTKALVERRIAPRAGLEPGTPEKPLFASDVIRVPEAGDEFRVVFPHAAHTAWLTCESCHPNPFQMKAGATSMSMDQVNAGALCGTCHGSVSFPVSACARCHPAMEETP
jgi:c(7)-type cytochrome triheme protein